MFCFSAVPAKKLTGGSHAGHANVWSQGYQRFSQAKIDPVQHLRITALGNAIDVAATVAVGGPGSNANTEAEMGGGWH